MIFRIFRKEELKHLFDILAAGNKIIGPAVAGCDSEGKCLFAFRQVRNFNDLRLDYTTTKISAKRYFLPYREDLATFRIEAKDWHKDIDYNIESPFIFCLMR